MKKNIVHHYCDVCDKEVKSSDKLTQVSMQKSTKKSNQRKFCRNRSYMGLSNRSELPHTQGYVVLPQKFL